MGATSPEQKQKATLHTAGCIIIGDEVLGGKTKDSNSNYFAKWCFKLGIQLKRIEVIADNESEIVEATRRMSDAYDFVVTSGGIGPTHDDITYQSIAKAFNLPLELHDGAFNLMKNMSKASKDPNFDWNTPSPQLEAKLRMVRLPIDKSRTVDDEQVVFVDKEKLWVPVSVVNGNVHILPGVPRLFESLIEGLTPRVMPRLSDPNGEGLFRAIIATPKSESSISSYLTELAGRCEPKGVKIGSYPRWGKKYNTVQLVGRDKAFIESVLAEVEQNVDGKRVEGVENVDDLE